MEEIKTCRKIEKESQISWKDIDKQVLSEFQWSRLGISQTSSRFYDSTFVFVGVLC